MIDRAHRADSSLHLMAHTDAFSQHEAVLDVMVHYFFDAIILRVSSHSSRLGLY